MKHITLFLGIFLLLLAGCQQDDLVPFKDQDKSLKSVRATTSSVVKSRTSLSGNSVIWENGDAIGIFSDVSDSIARYDLTGMSGDEAQFESSKPVRGNTFYAFYPYAADAMVSGTNVSFCLPAEQSFNFDSFASGVCPMVAQSTTNSFRFLQVCGLVRLNLKGNMNIQSISLSGNNGEALAGLGSVNIASDAPEFRLSGGGQESYGEIVLQGNVTLSPSQTTSFYFVVPPQVFSKGMTFKITGTVNGQQQTLTKATERSITVGRSVITSFSAVDTNDLLEQDEMTERDILIALYDATNGDEWTNNTNWCTDTDLSEWHGVSTDYQGRVISIDLYSNNLVGTIPAEIGTFEALWTLNLSYNQLSGEIPTSIAKLTELRNLYLSRNKLSGSIPSEMGGMRNLTYCYIYDNQLTGTVPETLGNLSELEYIDFGGNMLSGDLPQAVTSSSWWQKSGWVCISQNSPGGFNFDTFNLYMPDFTATDYKGNTINSASIVSSHKVTLYYIWASWCGYSKAFHPTVSSIYQRYKNHSLEIIGVCYDGTENTADAVNTIESNNMEWPTLLSNPGVISFTGFPTIMAFDENGKLIFHSSVTSRNLLPDFLKEILGEGDLPYESSDFSEDGKVYTLQKASEGNGINVVLMGDAFSDRQVADGTYEKVMRTAADAFFSEEPYTSFRNLFNVYYVTAVSRNEGYIDGGSTAFSGYFGSGTHVGGDNNKCMQYASTCPGMTDPLMNEVLIIVMMNSTKYAGTCYFGTSTAYQGDYGRGYGIAYFPIGTSDEELACVLHHEAGGHGFAKLLDEYYYESQGTIPLSEISDNINSRNHYGWGRNVDYTSDPNSVVWSKFISDSRYASEGIGVFEGACTYYKGAYRPTETSIMDANVGGFNAPSREAIYNRIHKLAYGESWQFDYEEFVGWDLNRQGRSRSISVQAKHEPTAPPVILNQHWENGRLVAN